MLPLVAFIILLVAGWIKDELSWLQIGLLLLFVVRALGVFAALQWQTSFYIALIALIDVVLVLTIFKGDIHLR
jgi:uncharacterized membrane protein